MYAIIETGGKQVRVAPGDKIRVEKLSGDKGSQVSFDRVLAVKPEQGDLKIGAPLVEGARVTAKVLGQHKARKILVFKYRNKTNYRRRYGHRQPYTELVIEAIEA